MDEDYVRKLRPALLKLIKKVTKAAEDATGNISEVLTLLHDVEVVVRCDIEDAEYLIEHLAMLTCDAYDGFKLGWVLLELFYQWAHLDCLRTGAEDEHYFLHTYILFIKSNIF